MIWTWRVRQVAIVGTIALLLLAASTLRELSSTVQSTLESAGIEGRLVAESLIRDLVSLSRRAPDESLATICQDPRIQKAILDAEVSAPSILHVAIYDAGGEIVAHTLSGEVGNGVEPMPALPRAPGTLDALRVVWSMWREPENFASEWPLVSDDGEPIAVIRVVSGSAFLLHDTRETFQRGLVSIAVLVLLSVGAGVFAAKSTSRRLRDLEASIAALRDGQRHEALDRTGWSEFGQVVHELNLLSERFRGEGSGSERARPATDRLLGEGILVCDGDGTVILDNEAAWARLGADSRDHSRIEEALPADHPLLDTISAVRDGRERSGSVHLSGPGGDFIAVVHRIGDGDGTAGLIVDIKGLEAHEELRGLVQHSRVLNRLGEMAAGVAHELRGPLQGLEFDLDALDSTLEEPDEARRMLSELQGKIRRLEWVVSGFLKVARIRPLRTEAIDAAGLIREVRDSLETEALMAGIEIDATDIEEGTAVYGDRETLARALENLLSNAIEARPSATGRVVVRAHRHASGMEIAISDTGPGIEEDRLAEVFDLYFTTKPHGTGVGLALVRQAVDLHNGDVRIDSRVGEGTTVTLNLPAAPSG